MMNQHQNTLFKNKQPTFSLKKGNFSGSLVFLVVES